MDTVYSYSTSIQTHGIHALTFIGLFAYRVNVVLVNEILINVVTK